MKISKELKKKKKKSKKIVEKKSEKKFKEERNLFSTFGKEISKKNHHKELLNRIIEDRNITQKISKKMERKKVLRKIGSDLNQGKENHLRENSSVSSKHLSTVSKRGNLSKKNSVRSLKSTSLLVKLKKDLKNTSKEYMKISARELNKWTNDTQFNPDVLKDFMEICKRSPSVTSKKLKKSEKSEIEENSAF